MVRGSITLLGTVLLLLVFAVPAVADAPIVVEEWDDQFDRTSQGRTEACGFDVNVSGHETGS